ncbi:uncharacterized protein LOC100838736 [Brachypodium distachyon]|uniref:Uncharacterized protein n=1 Tax=Brachypodium distachyon TaxID=15368 RepID=I1GMV4_BRADI|nr:uncharacterized protein LOC100838736 [Brachypodium distachyon]KQK12998.1 hypothetical protein BRADI_1g07330v3 [Brachypodium distachyon]|eukprot:XP_003559387.1 uncharacterized protein LOC100838736 [Brachypodium distachyon]
MSRGSSSKLRWLWRAPARALGRARDLYVRSVTGCARYVPSDAAFGAYPVPAPLPRSYSCGSHWGEDDDLRELIRIRIRAASQRQQQRAQAVPVGVARSQSTAGRLPASMARIDEDAPCEFGSGGSASGEGMYSRSRSYVGGGAEGIRRSRFHGKVATFGCMS